MLLTSFQIRKTLISEVKYLHQAIKISSKDGTLEVFRCLTRLFHQLLKFGGRCLTMYFHLQVLNGHFFSTTEDLEFSWSIYGDGLELGNGILSLPVIGPRGSYNIEWQSSPWYDLWASSSALEFFLTISVKLLHSTRWAEAGHIVSLSQVQLPMKREFFPHVCF